MLPAGFEAPPPKPARPPRTPPAGRRPHHAFRHRQAEDAKIWAEPDPEPEAGG